MNFNDFTVKIYTGSQDQRDEILQDVKNRPTGKEYCRHYVCEGRGEREVFFSVSMGRKISDEVLGLIDLPKSYPDITVEVWMYVGLCGLEAHRIYKKNWWEKLWTVDDAVFDWNGFRHFGEFDPSMLEIKTFRKAYDYDGNLITEENGTAPFPPEEMFDEARKEYEKWKMDPIAWEEKKTEGLPF